MVIHNRCMYDYSYSFLVPVYNVEKYLCKCVDSILSQEFPKSEYEIILVDDGSTDESDAICDLYADDFSCIRTIHQENQGLLCARKTAVQSARGEYLIFIDSDDYVDNHLLKTVDPYIREYHPDFLVYSYFIQYPNKRIPFRVTEDPFEVLDQYEMLNRYISTNKYNGISGKIIKSEILQTHIEEIYNKQTVNLGEDILQTAYLIKYSRLIVLVHDIVYHYMIRKDSLMHDRRTKNDIVEIIYMYKCVVNIIEEIMVASGFTDETMTTIVYSLATENVMENIYKYDKQIGLKGKDVSLQEIYRNNAYFFQMACYNCKKMKPYNRMRYNLFIKKRFKTLISLDVFLSLIQKMKNMCLHIK